MFIFGAEMPNLYAITPSFKFKKPIVYNTAARSNNVHIYLGSDQSQVGKSGIRNCALICRIFIKRDFFTLSDITTFQEKIDSAFEQVFEHNHLVLFFAVINNLLTRGCSPIHQWPSDTNPSMDWSDKSGETSYKQILINDFWAVYPSSQPWPFRINKYFGLDGLINFRP